MNIKKVLIIQILLTGCINSEYKEKANFLLDEKTVLGSQIEAKEIDKNQSDSLGIVINVEQTLGLITLGDTYSQEDTIKIFNKDGSLWYKFTYYYDDSDGQFEFFKKDFIPYTFHPDYFLLGLVVTERENKTFKVLVNEINQLEKHILLDDFLIFLSWEEYITSKIFSIEFDKKENPLKELPSTQALNLDFQESVYYHPVKIEGKWLQVKWGNEKKWSFGWVKWKQEGILLIELFALS